MYWNYDTQLIYTINTLKLGRQKFHAVHNFSSVPWTYVIQIIEVSTFSKKDTNNFGTQLCLVIHIEPHGLWNVLHREEHTSYGSKLLTMSELSNNKNKKLNFQNLLFRNNWISGYSLPPYPTHSKLSHFLWTRCHMSRIYHIGARYTPIWIFSLVKRYVTNLRRLF